MNVAYDAQGAGNLASIGSYTFSYDGENRMVTSTLAGTTTTYAYDGEGRRVQKIATSRTTTFVYDAQGQLAAEYESAPASEPCATCWVTVDHLGSTRLLTDASGNPKEQHDYLPFGEEIFAGSGGRTTAQGYLSAGTPEGVNTLFTGKERDAETVSSAMQGLDYFGARYFSAAQGRFTSPDWSGKPQPIPYADLKDPQTLDLYDYLRNNPLNRTDPDGHCCWDELVAAYRYVKSVAYLKIEGGRGLGVAAKVGPAKIDIEGKNAIEMRFASPDSTKKQVTELGAKIEIGPVKLGLSTSSEKLLAKNDQIAPADEKVESSVLPGFEIGDHGTHGTGSGWDIGIGVGGYLVVGGGIEIGVNGQKIVNDIRNLLNMPARPALPPYETRSDSSDGGPNPSPPARNE
jgi:RHS repeat-associated protein